MMTYEKKYWSKNEYYLQNGDAYEGYVRMNETNSIRNDEFTFD